MLTPSRSVLCFLFPCLSALAVLNALPAGAQSLRLGSLPGTTPVSSGTATVSAAGTDASGTYQLPTTTGTSTTTYQSVSLYNASTLNLEAGSTISTLVFNRNTSVVNIYGGSVKQLYSFNSSVTNIYGGTVFYPQAYGSSLSHGTVNVYGGILTYLAAQNAGVVDVFGSGLTETFLGNDLGFDNYSVTGTLQDGTALSVLYASDKGTLLFNGQPAVPLPAVPEASTTVSLGLLLALGLGSVVVACKKRSAV